MNVRALWDLGDHVVLWSASVLLQASLVAAFALAIGVCVHRRPALRYWVLCSSLLLLLSTPMIALLVQLSCISFFSVPLHTAQAIETDGPAAHSSAQADPTVSPPEGLTNSPTLGRGFAGAAFSSVVADDLHRNDDQAAER